MTILGVANKLKIILTSNHALTFTSGPIIAVPVRHAWQYIYNVYYVWFIPEYQLAKWQWYHQTREWCVEIFFSDTWLSSAFKNIRP